MVVGGNRFFAKSGDKYLELVVNPDNEYSYSDILELGKESAKQENSIEIESPSEGSSSSSEKPNDDEKAIKKPKKRKKKLNV